MPNIPISPKRPPRFPRFPYKANRLWPHERAAERGEQIFDAVSGALFPLIYAVESVYGLVDGRNGGVVDLDGEVHEVPITMRGPMRPPIT